MNDAELSAEFHTHIRGLPISHLGSAAKDHDGLDLLGADLWNLSTRLRRDDGAVEKIPICLLRVFAFLLLDTAHHARKGTAHNCVRLMKIALKAGKSCLDCDRLDFAAKVMESAAHYDEFLAKPENHLTPEDGPVCGRLRAEYYLLRTSLVCDLVCRCCKYFRIQRTRDHFKFTNGLKAWKNTRLDLAEHTFSKFRETADQLDPDDSRTAW